ncbi:vancomycin aglycone glucosyltransferase [Thermoflexales bacterium]|nr:vancomycin aglycone glucosyltransferase [Thermoflexales bacterium]
MRITILTIGTHGDVLPYVALGRGLHAKGHEVTIATLAQFSSFVTDYGLQPASLRGAYLEAARTPSGNPLKLIRQYQQMARETLDDEWRSAHNAEVFIYNPAAWGGYHIADKLGVPAFAAFPAPLYSPTREFPSPFFPFRSLGPFNQLSHRVFAKLGPALFQRPIKEWRRDTLGLPPARGEGMLHERPVTKLYAYSSAVVPVPADWDDSSVVTGYWFLDTPTHWQPPPELVSFLERGPAPVYVGFGSMAFHDAARQTAIVLEALRLARQRAVLATGWGGLKSEDVPSSIFVLDSVPHAWLFPQVAAVVHHGGAGTTGAGLRAGKPTVICPIVGDQSFWGRRIATLGAGPQPIPLRRLTAERLAGAIRSAVNDEHIRQRAASLGTTIRSEDGVGRALAHILGRQG